MESPTRLPFELTVTSPHSVPTTVEKLKQAVIDNGFSLQFELDIQATVANKGFTLPPTIVLGVCNAKLATRALTDDPRIIAQLPCRLGIADQNGQTTITMMNPALLTQMYSGPNVSEVAETINSHLKAIIDQATS